MPILNWHYRPLGVGSKNQINLIFARTPTAVKIANAVLSIGCRLGKTNKFVFRSAPTMGNSQFGKKGLKNKQKHDTMILTMSRNVMKNRKILANLILPAVALIYIYIYIYI